MKRKGFRLRASLPVGIWPRSCFGEYPKSRPLTVQLAGGLEVSSPACVFF